MKKTILLVLSIVAILCLFAISVAATEIDGVHYTLDKTNKVAKVNKENKTAQSEIANIPSFVTYEGVEYKVNIIENDAFAGNKTVKEIRILSEYITAIPYGMIANTNGGALEKIYINFSNIKSVGGAGLNPSSQTNGNNPVKNSFYYYDANAFLADGTDVLITEPDLSNCTSIGDAAFQGANFKKVTIPAAVSIANQMFRLSTIEELVIEGEDRQSIGYYNFQACKQLEKITIKSRNLKSIANDNFATCTAVTEIYIDLSKCQEVGSCAFTFANAYDSGQTRVQWYNLEGEKIVDLSSMKNFKDRSFASSNLGSAKIIWPKAIEALSDQTFRKCNINNQPIMICAADGVTLKLHFWAFNENSPSLLLCNEGVTETSARFSGTTAVFLAPSLKISDDKDVGFKGGSVLYCKGLAEGSKVPGGSNCTIINITGGTVNNYGACGVTANVITADGEVNLGTVTHTTSGEIDNALCPIGKVLVTSCKYCTYKYYSVDGTEVEKKEHSYDFVGAIVYESYFDMGFKTTKCECGAEKASDVATELALFIDYGYSCTTQAINGKYSVSQFFGINKEAVLAYSEATGKSFEYGVVVSSVSNPLSEENSALIEQGKTYLTDGRIFANDYVSVTVTGFTDGENGTVNNLDRQIAFCIFVKDGERVAYLDNGETVDSITMKSYNDVFAK